MTSLMSGRGRSSETFDDDVDLVRDRALVERAQAGDPSAFDDLYQRYYRRLFRFCLRRLHDEHEAEDVSQEAFARAWRALPNFAGDRRFYPWLSVIASHLCTDVQRRRNRSTPVAEFHQGNVASIEDSGEELAVAAADSAMVASAFRRLSDRHQRILTLREGSGWSYQRIADHEGVGITAVETLLWRARQALKREFAAVSGAEGRLAGVLGGLVSIAALRRLLRVPIAAARRISPSGAPWAPAFAAGTAAVAAAAVVAATTLVSPAPLGTGGSATPASAARLSAGPGTASGLSKSAKNGSTTASGDSTTPGGTSAAASGGGSGAGTAPGSLTTPGGGGSGNGATVGGSINNTLGGVTGSLSTTVGGLTQTLGPVSSALSPITGSVLGTLGNTASSTLGSTGSALAPVASTLQGALPGSGTTTTTTTTTTSSTTCTTVSGVGGIIGGVTGALGGSSSSSCAG